MIFCNISISSSRLTKLILKSITFLSTLFFVSSRRFVYSLCSAITSVNNFILSFQKTNIKRLENISIDYDIKFPKLYSEYAIDKVFNSGVIGEDKIFIEYYLVCSNILKKIIAGDFSFNYLVDFDINMRDKCNGWHNFHVTIKFKSGKILSSLSS